MSARTSSPSWWVARRLERLLRSVHQRRAERHRADRPLPRRGEAARGHRVRPRVARARHRSADRQPVLCLARLAAGEARGSRRRHRPALRPQSVPHMFIVRLPGHVADLPEDTRSDPGLAGRPRLGVRHRRSSSCCGAFVGPTIRKYTPRAAMLGALAGISIAFISMRPAALSWQVPWLAFISLGIILVSWCARVRLPWRSARRTGGGWWSGPCSRGSPPRPGSSQVMDPHAVVRRAGEIRTASAGSVRRLPGRAVRHRPASRRRRATRRLQLHRGHEQRRERLRRRRQLRPAQGTAGRRHRRTCRCGTWLAVPAGRLYRSSRLEIGRRPCRLFAGHRRRHRRWCASSA